MKLRRLELKDAPLMLEWMHDPDVCKYMKRDFNSMKLENCQAFIKSSQDDEENLHLAVVDDSDEYMGTVSLKEIDRQNGIAEFAITMRSAAMGKGYSAFGMREIIRYGLTEMGLKKVVWCVSKQNLRANRFYDKNGYKKITDVPQNYKELYPEHSEMNWYLAEAE